MKPYSKRRPKRQWECQLDPNDGDAFVKVPDDLDLSDVVSGDTTVFAPGMAVVDGQLVLLSPSEAVFGRSGRRHYNRELVRASSGTLAVVVVRISCSSGQQVTKSLGTIIDDVFNDPACLKTQMEACSDGKVQITQGPNGGGIEVTVNSCSNESAIRDATTLALAGILGQPPDRFSNTHFLYCMPSNIGWTDIGYAYINSWLSVYNDIWCSASSAQMHEVGHNLNLHHSDDTGEEYADLTGYMGYSSGMDDLKMCYNAAQMFQLGWLKVVAEFPSRPSGTFVLVGHTNFGGGTQAIRIKGASSSSRDTYVWFNDARGINADTREGQNQVIVTTRPAGVGFGKTLMVAKLDAGGIYNPSNFFLRVRSIENGQATVSFDMSNTPLPVGRLPPRPATPPPLPPPTNAPTTTPLPPPTSFPTTTPPPPPTSFPTTTPLPPPTSFPTTTPPPPPTSFPTTTPLPPPTSFPTTTPPPPPTDAPPTSFPTSAPVVPITPAPVPDPTSTPTSEPTDAAVPHVQAFVPPPPDVIVLIPDEMTEPTPPPVPRCPTRNGGNEKKRDLYGEGHDVRRR